MRPRDEAKRRSYQRRSRRRTLTHIAGLHHISRETACLYSCIAGPGVRIPRSMRPPWRKRTRDYWEWARTTQTCPTCERPMVGGRCPTQD